MIVWRDSYNIGVELIDSQHQELVRRLNDFMEACTQQKAKEKIGETLEFLKDYTVKHFGDEEALMKESGFPEFPEHKKIHDSFIATMEDLLQQFRSNGSAVLTTIKLNRILVDWLLNHIQGNDVRVGAHLKKN